nr:MAG TPA: hypothetical protein [Bacteriophage sp.]
MKIGIRGGIYTIVTKHARYRMMQRCGIGKNQLIEWQKRCIG